MVLPVGFRLTFVFSQPAFFRVISRPHSLVHYGLEFMWTSLNQTGLKLTDFCMLLPLNAASSSRMCVEGHRVTFTGLINEINLK